MAGIARSLPPDANPQAFAHHLRTKYGLGDYFYLDMWPIVTSQLVIVDPELAAQVTQYPSVSQQLDKGDEIRKYLGPLVGEDAMVADSGPRWRRSRRLFHRSMLHGSLLEHVPAMVDDCLLFYGELEKHAIEGDIFEMEDLTARLIFTIAVRAIMSVILLFRLESTSHVL